MRFTAVLLICSTVVFSATTYAVEHDPHHNHGMSTMPLIAAGNDAFTAIQEVVAKLLADPDTDWQRVNLEALRQHLVDMHNFVINVEVATQKAIDSGVEFSVKPTTPGAAGSLERLFSAHPAVLKQETGWNMVVMKDKGGAYTARVTSPDPGEAMKIRALGYIGIVAMGKHHQMHHWQMATGSDPHKGH